MEQQNNTFPQRENKSSNTTPSENALQSENQLRPCDCKDMVDVFMLQEQCIGHNEDKIMIVPNYVLLTMGHTQIKIPMSRFKMFAEWYLKPQEKNK